MLETLLLTLNNNALDAAVTQRSRFNIAAAVSGVPTLSIIEGDPSYSLVVTVYHEHVEDLRRAVGGMCIIGKDAVIDLY